jgi:hypothetical protein
LSSKSRIWTGASKKIDVPEDAAQARNPGTQVGAVREAVDFGGQDVRAGAEEAGDVELGGCAAVFGVADRNAVYPKIERRGDAVEMEKDLAACPIAGDGEFGAVGADGVPIMGDMGRVGRKGIALIEVDRDIIPLELPVAGDVHLFPGPDIVRRLGEFQGSIGRPGNPVKLPLSVEETKVLRGETVAGDRFLGG